jgi:flagellar biosynthesis/type III secretory pathway chaperone
MLHIQKPKKSEGGTFVCAIQQPFAINLDGSQLVHIKDMNDGSQFVFLKNKDAYNYMYDLNQNILNIVKSNCSSWFNTNMSSDLIDDYYTNTLVYDKTHGDLIKIKIIGDKELSSDLIGSTLNLELAAEHLRFYKQKFVLETSIVSAEVGCDIIEFSSDDDELLAAEDPDEPEPSLEDMEQMRAEALVDLGEQIRELTERLQELNVKKINLEQASHADLVKLLG